jgi:prepilin-type N-terminal cleavage/methylation domain-containing protein
MKRGFTLIELLMYMGLVSVFLTVLTSAFLSILDVQLESEAISTVEQDGRYILSRLVYDVHRASSITTPATVGQVTSTITLVIGGQNYSYSTSNNNLIYTSPSGTDNLNSYDSQISNLSITRVGNAIGKNSLQVGFTLTSITTKNNNKPEQKDFLITTTLR